MIEALHPSESTWQALDDEAVRHLQALIRCNTTNPPGNEIAAAHYLQEQLVAEGLETRIIESLPGRASVWARLPGKGTKRPLLLVSHLDVVPVERERWSVDPFGGEIQQGYLYGRGTVDTKSLTAKQLTLLLHLARVQRETGQRLERDLVLLAVADEEQHGTYGMAWIVQHEPALLDAEYAINEGGGFALDFGGTRIYLCATGEKGSVEVRLRAQGEPGHGSVPHANNAIVRLGRALSRIGASPLPLHVTETVRHFVQTLASTQKQPQRALLPGLLNPLVSETVLRAFPDQQAGNALRAMLHNTASPTILQAGSAINVIPGEATARLDGRIIPGQSAETFAQELRARIHDAQVHVEVEIGSPGYENSADTVLFAGIKQALALHEPEALVVPYLLPAVTDSRYIVPKGVIAYGFDPMRPEPGWPSPQQMAHGHDERISLANIAFGLHVLYDAVLHISR